MNRWIERLTRWAGWISAALLGAIFLVILAGVAARYGFARPLAWTDEVVVVLFVWLVFWTGALVVPAREHVAFEIVFEMLPPAGRRVAGFIGAAITAALLFYATPKTIDFIQFLWREKTPVLSLRLDFVYACFALFIAAAGLRFALRAFDMTRRDWSERL